MLFALLIAIFSETATLYIINFFKKQSKVKAEVYPINFIKDQYSSKVVFPESACTIVTLLGPVLAFAALLPVCAAIPFFSFIPIMANSPDLLQITQFFILSDTFAIITVYAVGSENSNYIAKRMAIDSVYLIFSMVAFFTVIATYIEIGGATTDVFRLNSVTVFNTLTTASSTIYLTMFVFVFLIFSQLPLEKYKAAKYFINDASVTECQGPPRLIMSLWSLFRSFIITALVVVIVSPLPNVPVTFQPWGISWIPQFINFFSFWITVIFTRVFLVSTSWAILHKFKSKLPNRLSPFVLPVLILIVTGFILMTIFILSSKAALF